MNKKKMEDHKQQRNKENLQKTEELTEKIHR